MHCVSDGWHTLRVRDVVLDAVVSCRPSAPTSPQCSARAICKGKGRRRMSARRLGRSGVRHAGALRRKTHLKSQASIEPRDLGPTPSDRKKDEVRFDFALPPTRLSCAYSDNTLVSNVAETVVRGGVGITSGLTVSSHPPHAAESVSPHPLGSEVDGGLGRGSVSPDPPP